MPDKTVQDYALYRLEKSADDLDTANIDFKANKYEAAANRAYYSIFHAIRSVLALDKVDFSKHSGVLGYFTKEYFATERFDKKYSAIIKKASVVRNSGDYDDFYTTSREEAEDIITQAADFCQVVREHVNMRLGQQTDEAEQPDEEPDELPEQGIQLM